MDYLGKNIPKLGFGLMRLPMNGEEIDMEQSKAMVDRFMSAGFNYFDTAYGYINGKSEKAVKTLLTERYPRESFILATKLPAWAGVKTAEEAKAMFYTSLERTGAGYFDFYLMHNCGENRTKCFDDFGIWEFALKLRQEGLIKHLGFSFHDKADVLDQMLNEHPEMEFVQLQINYADWQSSTVQSKKCYEVAMRHNKPVIIMEPVKGGLLASPPKAVCDVFAELDPSASAASWAMRYAGSLNGIITVLSGMSSIEQVEDNLKTMSDFKPLDEKERAAMQRASDIILSADTVPCTSCRYCTEVCPKDIEVPGILASLNSYISYENLACAEHSYEFATRDGGTADKCISCKKCEAVCPQHIEISEQLKRTRIVLGV